MSRHEAQIDNLTRHPQFPVGDNTFSITLAQLLLELLQALTFKPLHTATPTSSVTLSHVTHRVPRAHMRVRIESPKSRSWRSHTSLGVRQRRGFSPDAAARHPSQSRGHFQYTTLFLHPQIQFFQYTILFVDPQVLYVQNTALFDDPQV